MIFPGTNKRVNKTFENNILWWRYAQRECVDELRLMMLHLRSPSLFSSVIHLQYVSSPRLLCVCMCVSLTCKALDNISFNFQSFSQFLSSLPFCFLLSVILFRWCFNTCPIPYSTVLPGKNLVILIRSEEVPHMNFMFRDQSICHATTILEVFQ